MQAVKTIGLDIAKSVFQVHGVDAQGEVLIRRQLKRHYVLTFFQKLPSCLVGIEACASSHHWSRELKALGHTVRLMHKADASTARAFVSGHHNYAGSLTARFATLNKPRTCCYHFATQLGSSGRYRAIRDEPFAPNSPIKRHCAERTVTGRNANNRIRKPLLYPAELRDRCAVM
jgi:hypothetical protein